MEEILITIKKNSSIDKKHNNYCDWNSKVPTTPDTFFFLKKKLNSADVVLSVPIINNASK